VVVVFERDQCAFGVMSLKIRPYCFTHSRQKIVGGMARAADRLVFPSIGSALWSLPEADGPGTRLKLLCFRRVIGFPQQCRIDLQASGHGGRVWSQAFLPYGKGAFIKRQSQFSESTVTFRSGSISSSPQKEPRVFEKKP
jgi:hypothetical protein